MKLNIVMISRAGSQKNIWDVCSESVGSNPDNNVILTKTESLTMGKPSEPKYARNKNILVIGGSGSGKTRFFGKLLLKLFHLEVVYHNFSMMKLLFNQ